MSEVVHDHTGYTRNEMMIAAAARELAGQRVCFVGIGLPNIAVNLALHTVAPDLELIYEAGAYGAQPARLPLSIGDPTIVTGSLAVMSQIDLFGLYLQGGLVDVGFLGAAQIDRFGNINSTVIGDYARPKVRLPGSGGANEIALHSHQVFVVMRQSRRSFVNEVDFVTSPGNSPGHPRGPSVVVTDLGVYHFDDDGEMRLDTIHPEHTLDDVHEAMEWSVRVSPDLGHTPPPSDEELRLMREVLDPERRYLG
jgi:glutaconate CoA-transferase subunit B